MSEYRSSASVTFTIRVEGKGHWGADATVEQVMRTGGQETINSVLDALRKSGLKFKVIGEPQVGVITWGPMKQEKD